MPCQMKWKLLILNDLKGRYALLWLNSGPRDGAKIAIDYQ